MEQTDRETLRPRAAKKEQKHSERRQLGQVHPAVQGGSGQSLGWLDAQALKAQPCLSAEPPCLNSVDGDEFRALPGRSDGVSGSIPLGCMRSLSRSRLRTKFAWLWQVLLRSPPCGSAEISIVSRDLCPPWRRLSVATDAAQARRKSKGSGKRA